MTIEDVEAQSYSLSIPLYVHNNDTADLVKTLDECIDDWISQSAILQSSLNSLTDLLEEAGELHG